jgi:hypothetical protein
MSTQDLISAISTGDYATAEDAFAAVMSDKVSTALDAKRIEVAKSLFKTEEEVEVLDGEEMQAQEAIDSEEETKETE